MNQLQTNWANFVDSNWNIVDLAEANDDNLLTPADVSVSAFPV